MTKEELFTEWCERLSPREVEALINKPTMLEVFRAFKAGYEQGKAEQKE